MVTLSIPQQNVDGLGALLTLPSEVFDELLLVLGKSEISASPAVEIQSELQKLPGIDAAEAMKIAQAYASLLVLQAQTIWEPDQLVVRLIAACAATEDERLINESSKPETRGRLSRLLSVEPLQLSAKAVFVKFNQDNQYFDAAVITSILPVFGHKIEELPKASMIVHQLSIDHVRNGKVRRAYFQLDLEEVGELIAILQRAQRKSEALKTLLNDKNLGYIENV